jgi:hypothetical protein
MSLKSILTESKFEILLKVIEEWLLTNNYNVTVIANRIDAQKDNKFVSLFLESFSSGCSIKIFSDEVFLESLRVYLGEKHLITHKIKCSYCDWSFDVSLSFCPNCGAIK